MNIHRIAAGSALLASLLLTACASPEPRQIAAQEYPAANQPYAIAYGVIDSIQAERQKGESSGAGAAVGGIVGGVLGNQVGGGVGRTAATVAGAVGGAVAGNQIERSRKTKDVYQIGVRLDNGRYEVVTQNNVSDLRIGDRVQVENGYVHRY